MEENEEEGLKILEDSLKSEIIELKSQIEENQLVYGIPSKGMSSIYVPKDPDHFRRQRKLILQRTLQVTDERPVKVQAEIMRMELSSCDSREYTEKSVPLLIHQYFLDRIQEMLAAKHAHLLRWKRYCINTAIIESIYPEYKERLQHIMDEYLDSSSRAHRLATSKEGFLSQTEQGVDELNTDDMIIYLRWLICHFQSLKLLIQVNRVIQWFPIAHRKELAATILENIEVKLSDEQSKSEKSMAKTPATFTDDAPLPPPLVAATFVSTKPMKPTEFNLSLAAAGGGMVTDEKNLNLPLHTNDLNHLRPHLIVYCNMYGIEMDVVSIRSSADEMELYSSVNRKFKTHFNLQEQMKTFKAYDFIVGGLEKWGLDSHTKCVMKPANWLQYKKLKPQTHLAVVKFITKLRAENKIDELLKAASRFISLTNCERVQDALRHHALLVQHPPVIHSAAVISHRQGINISEIFKKIYMNQELLNPNNPTKNETASINDTHDNYEFNQTMQMLGLDDSSETKDDPSSVQGAYLSYLHLRHLKIRDLQRTCLSILNYFRSVERTITINDQGLSLNSGVGDRSYQNHRSGSSLPGHQGGGGNIGSHGYLFNTPREFRIHENDFMQFAEVENHDDFYFHEDGRIHIRDQTGHWIIYDIAVADFEKLEHDLLLIASVFISKNKNLRNASMFKRKRQRTEENQSSDFDIGQYSHHEVDRFGVLHDIWTNHTALLECKKKILDIYMEAYNNTFNRDERCMMAQAMVNLMYKKPRIDLESQYFVAAYRLECAILRMQADIFRTLLNKQIERQREYVKMIGNNIQDFGLPLPVVEKLPIAVNADESILKNIYFLEFHESLSIISHIKNSLEWCFKEILYNCKPLTVTQEILLEKKMYEIMQLEMDSMDSLGVSYTPQIQRDLFSGFFIDNPIMITQLADDYLKNIDSRNTRGDKRSRKIKLINEFSRLYEVITLRFRLLDATWESEVLAKIYQKQALDLGYDEFHLYLRPIQFEAAKKKEGAEVAKPLLYISTIQDDDSTMDKFTPSALPLAINEVDEVGVGKFSFKGRGNVLEMLESKGVENLMIVLKMQLCHKNALAAGVSLCNACRPSLYNIKEKDLDICNPTDLRSDRSTTTGVGSNFSVPISAQAGPTPLALDSKRADSFNQKDAHPEAFFSIQLEKSPCRDRAMNAYIKKFSGTGKTSGVEVEKTKRDLILSYIDDFFERIQQASLRSQIIYYFNSIIHVLKLVPSVSNKFFQFGEAFEKKNDPEDNTSNQENDPRKLRKRARRILSENGSKFLNLWFVPHFTEILFLFRQFDDERTTENLKNLVNIVGNFHDTLHFLVGFSRLQISSAKISTELKAENVDVNNSVEHSLSSQYVGTELIEIDHQISHLNDPTNVKSVIELLSSRRNVTFMKFEYCISHALLETFLASRNVKAYMAVAANMRYPFEELTNVQKPISLSVRLNVPEPLEARDKRAAELYPYRSLINQFGPYLIMHDFWKNIQENIQLCLAGLSDVDRPTVHGEFVSLNLCLEDVLVEGNLPEARSGEKLNMNDFENVLLLGKKFHRKDKKEVTPNSPTSDNSLNQPSSDDKSKNKLNVINHPVQCYNLMMKYIILSKRLNLLKNVWGARKLGLEKIETPEDFKMFNKIYKTEKLYPLMKSLCIQYRLSELSQQGPMADTDIFVTPKGIPEIVVKQRQLGKMIESFESTMIGDLRKRIIRQTDQVMKERNREEGNLPLDLWKKPAMKEAISVKRPVIAEDFVYELMQFTDLNDENIKNNDTLIFTKVHLNKCLQNLAISVLHMQKESYENYAMYYENQLKHQHQLLYSREREIEDMKQQLLQKELATIVDVQFQLADQAHSLLLEVNALRAKVAEMREDSLQQEQAIREEVRQEYNAMVQNLFSVAFEQKMQIDVYREYLHDATLKRIQEVRTEAAIEMNKVKEKSGAKVTADDELAERNLKLSKELTSLHQQNIHLKQMMSRMKSLFNWHHTFIKCNFQKAIASIEKDRDKYKNSVTVVQMNSEQKVQIMGEELDRLKQYLTSTEKELNDLRKTLDKEMKEKMDKKHAAERKAATDKQMALVKQMHIDQLMSEITEKNSNIATMSRVLNENMKSHKTVADKSVREVDALKKSLREERKMKQSAFTKVDDLISQVYEFEAAFAIVKGNTPINGVNSKTSDSISCSQISRPNTGLSGNIRSGLKPITPDMKISSTQTRPRPITVGAHQLRKRIADQLLMNLEPETHEQLSKSNKAL